MCFWSFGDFSSVKEITCIAFYRPGVVTGGMLPSDMDPAFFFCIWDRFWHPWFVLVWPPFFLLFLILVFFIALFITPSIVLLLYCLSKGSYFSSCSLMFLLFVPVQILFILKARLYGTAVKQSGGWQLLLLVSRYWFLSEGFL